MVIVALHYFANNLGTQAKKLADDQGLTSDVRRLLAINHFKKWLAETKEYTISNTRHLMTDCSDVNGGLFASRRFNLVKNESPEFLIYDENMTDEQRLDLLQTAYENHVLLHMRSLEYCKKESKNKITNEWFKKKETGRGLGESI